MTHVSSHSIKNTILSSVLEELFYGLDSELKELKREAVHLNDGADFSLFPFSSIRKMAPHNEAVYQFCEKVAADHKVQLQRKVAVSCYISEFLNKAIAAQSLVALLPPSVVIFQEDVEPSIDDLMLITEFKQRPEYAQMHAQVVFNNMGV